VTREGGGRAERLHMLPLRPPTSLPSFRRDLTSGKADFTLDGYLSAADKKNISKGEPHLTDVNLVLTPGNARIANGDLRVDLRRPRDLRA